MGGFIKGEVVVLPVPFSDPSLSKRRPALVLSSLPGDDVILCMITSQATQDRYSIVLRESDFNTGSLKRTSYVRPSRVFTADSNIILRSVGTIAGSKLVQIVDTLVEIIKG